MYYQAYDISEYGAAISLTAANLKQYNGQYCTLVYDSRVDDLAIYDAVVTEEMDASGSFKFTMPANHPYINQFGIIVKDEICVVEYNDDNSFNTMLFGGFLGEKDTDLYGNKTLVFYGYSIALHNTPMTYYDYTGKQFSDVADQISNQLIIIYGLSYYMHYTFTFGTYDSLYVPASIYSGQEMATDFLNRIASLINSATSSSTITFHYYTEYDATLEKFKSKFVIGDYGSGAVSDQTVQCGKNLFDYRETILDGDFFTGVIGLGAETDEEHYGHKIRVYEYNSEAPTQSVIHWNNSLVSTYGKKVTYKVWDDITNTNTLSINCNNWIGSMKLKRRVDCKVFDLSKITNVDRFDLGEIVNVQPPIGQATAFLITKIERNLNDPSQDNITLQNW